MAAVIRGRWRIRIHSLRPRLLTRIVSRRMIFVVDAAIRRDREQPESETKTLGDLLYANKANFSVSEKDWVRLVQAIAARDQLALHSLYEQTHRIVFTLIVRITNNRETAEELTIDVFYDVWRRASAYDPAGGSVVGWIMNQARSRANDPQQAWHVKEQNQVLQNALEVLAPEERQVIESAFFSELTYPEVAAKLNQPLGTVKTRIRSGLSKLRQKLEATLKAI